MPIHRHTDKTQQPNCPSKSKCPISVPYKTALLIRMKTHLLKIVIFYFLHPAYLYVISFKICNAWRSEIFLRSVYFKWYRIILFFEKLEKAMKIFFSQFGSPYQKYLVIWLITWPTSHWLHVINWLLIHSIILLSFFKSGIRNTLKNTTQYNFKNKNVRLANKLLIILLENS